MEEGYIRTFWVTWAEVKPETPVGSRDSLLSHWILSISTCPRCSDPRTLVSPVGLM
jgi:hypothetical protein